ncbi:hypothetical protein LguiA_034439 [Lonicera macranthoides]
MLVIFASTQAGPDKLSVDVSKFVYDSICDCVTRPNSIVSVKEINIFLEKIN